MSMSASYLKKTDEDGYADEDEAYLDCDDSDIQS